MRQRPDGRTLINTRAHPRCPDCGGSMRLIVNPARHDPFWGCMGYRLYRCRGNRTVLPSGEPQQDRPWEEEWVKALWKGIDPWVLRSW